MSTYEKIATAIIAVLVLGIIVYSYREYKESPEHPGGPMSSAFDQSVGKDFKIGNFATVVDQQSSGSPEDNCVQLQPILIGTLHDIKERLEHMKPYSGTEDAFEVNVATLTLLCNTTATITLADSSGNQLFLEKVPFTRATPQGGGSDDVGTVVHINATVIPKGSAATSTPTTYGEELIPDRFLDTQ